MRIRRRRYPLPARCRECTGFVGRWLGITRLTLRYVPPSVRISQAHSWGTLCASSPCSGVGAPPLGGATHQLDAAEMPIGPPSRSCVGGPCASGRCQRIDAPSLIERDERVEDHVLDRVASSSIEFMAIGFSQCVGSGDARLQRTELCVFAGAESTDLHGGSVKRLPKISNRFMGEWGSGSRARRSTRLVFGYPCL